MISLAKLHGVSHLLVKENGGMSKYLERNPHLSDLYLNPETEAMMSTFMNPSFEALLGILKVISHPHKSNYFRNYSFNQFLLEHSGFYTETRSHTTVLLILILLIVTGDFRERQQRIVSQTREI